MKNKVMGIGDQGLWIALIIGNSRWHWGAFEGDRWLGAWHTTPLTKAQVEQLHQGRFAPSIWQQLGIEALPWQNAKGLSCLREPPELWMASVVSAPLTWLASYANVYQIKTEQVPLQNTYPTLGVDRALALVGAGDRWGWPVLVIDCGTALTFTAGANQRLIGGAILPGLRSQFRALHAHTDRLPALDLDLGQWPQRWATDTPGAIASGILHSQLAGIRDFILAWEAEWPQGAIVLTGGDSAVLYRQLNNPLISQSKKQTPAPAQRIDHDPDLGFWGLRVCRQQGLKTL